jgi:hypothetical protein
MDGKMADDEFLTDLRRVLSSLGGTSVADLELQQLRQRWGGERVYIPKKEPPAGKLPRLAGAIAAGQSLREAMETAGVKKSQGYAYLRLRWRCR